MALIRRDTPYPHWEFADPGSGDQLRDGLAALQRAFREASPIPDPPGQGPGERLTPLG